MDKFILLKNEEMKDKDYVHKNFHSNAHYHCDYCLLYDRADYKDDMKHFDQVL